MHCNESSTPVQSQSVHHTTANCSFHCAAPELPSPAKPRARVIQSGAISLPRKRDQWREAARRRGSYQEAFPAPAPGELQTETAEDKVGRDTTSGLIPIQ